MSVGLSAPTGRIVIKFLHLKIYQKSVEKIQTWLKYDKNNGIWWGKFSQKHNYKYMAKWWCLVAMEKNYMFRPIAAIFRFWQLSC